MYGIEVQSETETEKKREKNENQISMPVSGRKKERESENDKFRNLMLKEIKSEQWVIRPLNHDTMGARWEPDPVESMIDVGVFPLVSYWMFICSQVVFLE